MGLLRNGSSSGIAWILACSLGGCSTSQATKLAVNMVPTHHWQNALLSFSNDLIEAHGDFRVALQVVVDKATKLPARKQVSLGDLHDDLRRFQGKAHVDFLTGAKGTDGEPIDFSYPQFDVPEYDAFLAAVAHARALSYQTQQTLEAMVQTSSLVLKQQISASPSLHVAVGMALHKASPDSAEAATLRDLQLLAKTLGLLVVSYARSTEELVKRGEELRSSGGSMITSTVVLTHLPEFGQSVVSSVKAIGATARWSADIAITLRGFARVAEPRTTLARVDDERLSREELAALLFEP